MANRERRIRKSQLISPYGVGAIIEFPNETLMHAGLDAWDPHEEYALADDRLAKRLKVQMFYEPPQAPDKNVPNGKFTPFVRFPLWHVCPRCRAMQKVEWNSNKPPTCNSNIKPRFNGFPCSSIKEKWKQSIMVPVRFIVACSHGHIEDFPWVEWAHSKGKTLTKGTGCSSPRLRLNYTGRSGLMGLSVECQNCNEKRSLAGAAHPDMLKNFGCSGHRPWLGSDAKEDCKSEVPPKVTQRGATNIYFSDIVSSILIPPYSTYVRRYISKPRRWNNLTGGVNEDGSIDKTRVEILADAWGIPFKDIMEAINHKLNNASSNQGQTEEDYRYEEYKAYLAGKNRKRTDDLNIVPQSLDNYEPSVIQFFDNLVLVEKLTETRALTGFTRMDPSGKSASLSKKHKDWLPAVRGYGEGIFFTLNQELLNKWQYQKSTNHRCSKIQHRMDESRANRGQDSRRLSPVFILLHTFSHILINQLSFDCGYGSSALRERIYCRQDGDEKMAGVLIYTSASDSEGTLGGLVMQGKEGRFEPMVKQALIEALNCSSDPLCTESDGQGSDALNLAACHACALLPETSCEEGNRLLDRLLLIGSHKDKKLGFFENLINDLLKG